MKITTPQGFIIEMTPDEARAMFPQLFQEVGQQVGGMAGGGAVAAAPVPEVRLVRRVLKRHRIPPAQRALYKALYEAGDDGLDFTTLAATIGRSTEELSGVLGGLGRRVNATPGIETLPETPGVNLLFEHKDSAPPNGTWGWAMKPELRQVLGNLQPEWLTDSDDDAETD